MLKQYLSESDILKIANSPENSEDIKKLILNFEKEIGDKQIAEKWVAWYAIKLRKSQDIKETSDFIIKKIKKLAILLSKKEFDKINPFETKWDKNDIDDFDSDYEQYIYSESNEDIEKILDNEEVMVINLKTFKGAQHMSQGNDEWCTADDIDYFTDYISRGPIFRIFVKAPRISKKYKILSLSVPPGQQDSVFLHKENRKFNPLDKNIFSEKTLNDILNVYNRTKKINLANSFGSTVLFNLLLDEDTPVESIYSCIEQGASPKFDKSLSYLSAACSNFGEYPSLIEWLCKNGADPNLLYSNYGFVNTALHTCTIRYVSTDEPCYIKNISILLRYGADINKENEEGKTAFYISFERLDGVLMKLLIKKGADPNIHIPDRELCTPLIHAAFWNDYFLVRDIIANKADLEYKDRFKNTALIYACEEKHNRVIKLLIDSGANINIKNAFGYSPLSISCENNNYEIVEYLIEKGVLLDQKSIEKATNSRIKKLIQDYK